MSVKNAERFQPTIKFDVAAIEKMLGEVKAFNLSYQHKYYRHKTVKCLYTKITEIHGSTATVLSVYDYSDINHYLISTTEYFDINELSNYDPISEEEFVQVRNKAFHHIVDAM